MAPTSKPTVTHKPTVNWQTFLTCDFDYASTGGGTTALLKDNKLLNLMTPNNCYTVLDPFALLVRLTTFPANYLKLQPAELIWRSASNKKHTLILPNNPSHTPAPTGLACNFQESLESDLREPFESTLNLLIQMGAPIHQAVFDWIKNIVSTSRRTPVLLRDDLFQLTKILQGSYAPESQLQLPISLLPFSISPRPLYVLEKAFGTPPDKLSTPLASALAYAVTPTNTISPVINVRAALNAPYPHQYHSNSHDQGHFISPIQRNLLTLDRKMLIGRAVLHELEVTATSFTYDEDSLEHVMSQSQLRNEITNFVTNHANAVVPSPLIPNAIKFTSQPHELF